MMRNSTKRASTPPETTVIGRDPAQVISRMSSASSKEPSRQNYSLYDLVPNNSNSIDDFVASLSARTPPNAPRITVPANFLPKAHPFQSVDPEFSSQAMQQAAQVIKNLEEALKQERNISDSLRKRLVELEAGGRMRDAKTQDERNAGMWQDPMDRAPSSLVSDWKVKLEEIQKDQFARLVGSRRS